MARYVTAYLATIVFIAAVDFLWTSQVGPALYYPVLAPIMAVPPRVVPGVLFYLIYAAGLVYFAVAPALVDGRWQTAFGRGAALGIVAYATYDLTNNASLAVWTTRFSIVDMAWGTVLSGVSSTVGLLTSSRLFRRRAPVRPS